DLDADQRPAVFQDDTPRLEAGRDRAARLQDGLDDVDAGKPAADAGQLRADPFTLVPEPMAFDALRLLSVEEEGAAALGVSRPHQGRLGELLLFSGGAFSPKMHLEHHGPSALSRFPTRERRRDLHEQTIDALAERRRKPVGIGLEGKGLVTAMSQTAVE